MARAANKIDLLNAAETQFGLLWELIESLSLAEQQQSFVFDDRDKNVRDVLAHLYEWHLMMERWHQIGCIDGNLPDVPAKGYTWRTLPALNLVIWQKYQSMPLEQAKEVLKQSHQRIIDLIEQHSNNELFSKGIYKFTKTTTLGSYFISATSSHYDWALNKIKKHKKLLYTRDH